MKTITRCQCGNSIILTRKDSYKKVNRQKLCISCFNNPVIFQRVKGSRSYYRTPYHAALFNTLCGLQRERKALILSHNPIVI